MKSFVLFMVLGTISLSYVNSFVVEGEVGNGDDILHRLQILEQQNNLHNQQIDTQQQQITNLLTVIQDMKTQHLQDIQMLQAANDHLLQQIDILKDNNQDVSFFAYLQNTIANPTNGQTIVFDLAMTNTGNDYDPSHGVFTAPVNGTYFFTLTGTTPPQGSTHLLHLYITLNGAKHLGYIFLDHNGGNLWLQRSTSVVVRLIEGDRIWVVSLFGEGALAGYEGPEDKMHSHFSGFLIHGD